MDTLAIELRLSILQNEMIDLASHLPDRRGEIIRYSARILGLYKSVVAAVEPANDNGVTPSSPTS